MKSQEAVESVTLDYVRQKLASRFHQVRVLQFDDGLQFH